KVPRLQHSLMNERPFVAVQLPIYNERYVVRRLVDACAQMVEQYGIDDAEINILDDSTDDTRQIVDDIVSEYSQKKYHIQAQRRPDRRGYKAGALQIALQNTNAEFLAIFDADYTPPSDFLERTIPYLLQDNQLGIVQSRWTHLNRYYNRITSAVAIGIDVHFFVEQTGRYATHCFQNFNGSGGVLRKSALVDAGGWQADTLAEDLDASYRMQLNGYHVLYLKDLPSPGEVPPTIPSFKKQQARWANGSLRTARKLLPSILPNHKIKFYQRLEAYIHLTGYLLHPMMFISFLLASFGTLLEVDTFLIHSHMLTPFGGAFASFDPIVANKIHNLSWGILDAMILLSMVAAWLSPLITLKLQNLSIRKNLPGLLVLFLLGSGISVSNSVEAVKALFTNRIWEFKRTPKYANLQGKEGWRNRRYQIPLDFVFVLEVASVILGLTATVVAILHTHYAVLAILVPYTTAYLFITLLTLRQSRPQSAI
ncbi:MAG TPA: glycosyltransferase family 2 protein, partial [Anaerolineales bacterium]|nr:glycosyltransferase family 2 protein [Anaerolineales bacterium]